LSKGKVGLAINKQLKLFMINVVLEKQRKMNPVYLKEDKP
jgi:hypothetical protein